MPWNLLTSPSLGTSDRLPLYRTDSPLSNLYVCCVFESKFGQVQALLDVVLEAPAGGAPSRLGSRESSAHPLHASLSYCYSRLTFALPYSCVPRLSAGQPCRPRDSPSGPRAPSALRRPAWCGEPLSGSGVTTRR